MGRRRRRTNAEGSAQLQVAGRFFPAITRQIGAHSTTSCSEKRQSSSTDGPGTRDLDRSSQRDLAEPDHGVETFRGSTWSTGGRLWALFAGSQLPFPCLSTSGNNETTSAVEHLRRSGRRKAMTASWLHD